MWNAAHPREAGRGAARPRWQNGSGLAPILLAVIMMGACGNSASAQNLDWEGQTGIFVTPTAYIAPSGAKGFGLPIVAYHYLDGGQVLGGFNQVSITVGGFNRLEFGYTRDLHQEGSTTGLSNLWSSGFNIFHGKLSLLREKESRQGWLPSLSVGFVARTQVRNVGGVMQGKDTTNADFYVVATKSVTQLKKLPLVFNLGYKATNASLLGLAGNAPAYKGRAFGAAAFVVKGPKRSTLVLGSELLQEPRNIEGLPTAVVPTTITYFVRVVPSGAFFSGGTGWSAERPKLSLDFGVAQVAGTIQPGVNLQARSQFAFGISYGF
jgi:hypothetical protein